MMSDKRFELRLCPNGTYYVWENGELVIDHISFDKWHKEDANDLIDLLNELAEENDKLKKLIKENVFGRYKEGSLADLKFKAIAYDDIVKLEMSNDSEPKVIVICRQGKKENVKSFCQMFIPFGVYYEIKEVIE